MLNLNMEGENQKLAEAPVASPVVPVSVSPVVPSEPSPNS